MPFGTNPKLRTIVVDKDGDPVITRAGGLTLRRVSGLPEAPAPPWYTEYLLEEWKRKMEFEQKRPDSRTRCKRTLDEWHASERLRSAVGLLIVSTGAPRHDVWGMS